VRRPGDSRSDRTGASHAAHDQTEFVLGFLLQRRCRAPRRARFSQPGHLRAGDGFVRFDRHRQRAPIAKVEGLTCSKLQSSKESSNPKAKRQPRAFAPGIYFELWFFALELQSVMSEKHPCNVTVPLYPPPGLRQPLPIGWGEGGGGALLFPVWWASL